jgi:Retinal pigment epithelial membrane protein
MSWRNLQGKMSEGLHLSIPQSEFFDKSPIGTPTKVLQSLDLLSVDGEFVPKRSLSPYNETAHSSLAHTPVLRRRFQTQSKEFLRRKSMYSDVTYDHTISDEFSHINLTIKERRPSTGNNVSPPPYTFAPISTSKRVVYRKLSVTNQIVIAKVLAEDGDEDEIEIIDLDDDEEYLSSFNNVCEQPKENCYPNCDVNVWLRSCEQEIIDPVEGVVSGEIPSWINGSLLRNGPGSIKVGDSTYNHLFDAAALLHRFNIYDGKVTYQCRFLKSETFKKNSAANRIVVSEFGTALVPDPCQSIFER